MKTLDLIGSAIANTFRSKTRTILTILAIFVGAFTLTITNGLGTGINQYIDDTVAAMGADDVMTVTKVADNATEDDGPREYDPEAIAGEQNGPPGTTNVVAPIDSADIDDLAEIDGVAASAAREERRRGLHRPRRRHRVRDRDRRLRERHAVAARRGGPAGCRGIRLRGRRPRLLPRRTRLRRRGCRDRRARDDRRDRRGPHAARDRRHDRRHRGGQPRHDKRRGAERRAERCALRCAVHRARREPARLVQPGDDLVRPGVDLRGGDRTAGPRRRRRVRLDDGHPNSSARSRASSTASCSCSTRSRSSPYSPRASAS